MSEGDASEVEVSPVDQLVERLREAPPALDDVRRARMERGIVGGLEERLEEREGGAGAARRGVFVAGMAAGLAAAAAVALVFWVWAPPTDVVQTPTAHVDAMRDGLPVRSDALVEGSTVQTTERQLLRLRFGEVGVMGEPTSLVEVSPSTRAVFERISGDLHHVRLARGDVRVEFHPVERGREGFRVDTDHARVDVVGTVFEVHADEQGTVVRVHEGVVRVTPHAGVARLVRAGEQTWVESAPLGALEEDGSALDDGAWTETVVDEAEAEVEEVARPPSRPTTSVLDGHDDEMVAIDEGPAPGEASVPLADDLRFELAQSLFDQERLSAARHELYAIARTSGSRASRARAWTLVAETFERESDLGRAAEAYRRAARSGHGSGYAANALFALARVRAATGDEQAAEAAYTRYLQVAPAGPLANEARRALCRLGVTVQCAE